MKFTIIGVGKIGKRHAELIEWNSETELVAYCDVENKTLDELPFFDSVDAMLNVKLEIDEVNTYAPNGLHAENCLKALNAGKHVVCEKHFALT